MEQLLLWLCEIGEMEEWFRQVVLMIFNLAVSGIPTVFVLLQFDLITFQSTRNVLYYCCSGYVWNCLRSNGCNYVYVLVRCNFSLPHTEKTDWD